MTSAKQGPWTDIYGLSATLYHAITGHTPPSAFDRMLDDAYEPLGKMAPPGFARGLLAGIDAGLAVRATDRPQTIAGWRPILGQFAALAGDATVALVPPAGSRRRRLSLHPSWKPRRRRESAASACGSARPPRCSWCWPAATTRWSATSGATPQMAAARGPSAVEKAAQDAQLAAEAQRLKDQEELARLRTEAAAREKAEQEAAQRRQIEEETRRKVEAEMADKQRQQDEARQKAEADAAASAGRGRREEGGRDGRERAAAHRYSIDSMCRSRWRRWASAPPAPTALSAPRTREMIAAWQKTHNDPPTGYLTGAQNQALLRDAAPAVARFDEEQKKLDEARKKADEEKAKAEAAARAAPPPPQAAVAPPAARGAQQRGRGHAEIGTRRHLAAEPCSARRRAMAARSFSIC